MFSFVISAFLLFRCLLGVAVYRLCMLAGIALLALANFAEASALLHLTIISIQYFQKYQESYHKNCY